MHVVVVAAIAGLVALWLAVRQSLRLTQDPREPPLVATTVPYLTPVIGTLRFKSKYYSLLRDRYRLPIYTLRLPGLRLYVVNTPQMISAVQKNFKVLTFQAVTDRFSALICDTSKIAQAVQKRQLEEWQHGANSASSPSHMIFRALSPGDTLDEMNRIMVGRMAKEMEIVASKKEQTVGLFEWVKEVAGVATTDGVYGDSNPYRDPKFRQSFWEFEAGLATLSLGLLPNLLASSSTKARAYNVAGFESYFSSGAYLKATTLTRNRYEWHAESGYPLTDIAKLEVGNGIAILANTVPTAFWAIYHIFSNPDVWSSCQDEVQQHTETQKNDDGSISKHLDISKLRTSSPLLLSAFKEAMRLHSVGVGVRQVMSDTLLNGTYLLKKDSLIMMPSKVQHSDPELWGLDVEDYKHERFIPPTIQDKNKSGPKVKTNPVSFRAFGGGTTLCPGRHFATTEVLVLLAILLVRFKVVPAATGAQWKEVRSDNAPMTAAMPKPDQDIDVTITQREEDKGVKWVYSLSAGDGGLAIAAEDME